ncbi:MAG: hypothetical protein JRG76_15230 [Deltaproteobacteria bacterium]|jgi:hypothetical protein|nr:hypothetical protein [Deltaproteobacteria bacterium]MBW2415852.1 hypothetical protein [Deltaproteobacteria bacterium]
MSQLCCHVFRGLPKEIEEEVNKFLESTPCEIHHVLQSESTNHVTITIFYVMDAQEDPLTV